jgi:hypothetical protein
MQETTVALYAVHQRMFERVNNRHARVCASTSVCALTDKRIFQEEVILLWRPDCISFFSPIQEEDNHQPMPVLGAAAILTMFVTTTLELLHYHYI